MAKTKTKGTNLPVPQNDAEAEQMIAQLGALQRDAAEAKAHHDGMVAALETEYGKVVQASQDSQKALVEGLNIWASAHRERLTSGGRTKTVQLPTGTLLWRDGRYSVKHRPLKVDEVVEAIHCRLNELDDAIKLAKLEKRRKDALALYGQMVQIQGFLRLKAELNKEAMLAAREAAETIPGVTIPRGAEEFAVEPLASQISEVA